MTISMSMSMSMSTSVSISLSMSMSMPSAILVAVSIHANASKAKTSVPTHEYPIYTPNLYIPIIVSAGSATTINTNGSTIQNKLQ
jgi:hypothetical protein